MDLIANPYRGSPNVPHIDEEWFKIVFLSSNIAFAALCFPGRFLGTEISARRYNRDLIMRICEENAIKRQVRRGKIPKFYYRAPNLTYESWPRMWDQHLHWKRWQLERTGPLYRTS